MLGMALMLLSGCVINRDIMFKTPRDYQFDTVTDTLERQFKIQPNDIVSFRLFANDGFKMIDLINQNETSIRNTSRLQFDYSIDPDGFTKLPVIGRVQLGGLTVREAENKLELLYATYYQQPFVLMEVNNRRVVVFPGGGGDAKIIPLQNNNTTLLEVLASAGGVAPRGDSRKVKLFRRDSLERKVFQFDLSDISNLRYADMVMQADDVVYVQPNPEIARGILREITPLITLLTTTILVIGIAKSFGK